MSTASLSYPVRTRIDVGRVLVAAAAVWLLDGLFATSLCLSLSATCTVTRTWQGVAGALVGRPATFEMGAATFALGLAIHFCVALGWSMLYALVVSRWEALARATSRTAVAAAVGSAYGVVVWLAMNFVVVPMTLNKPTPFGTRAWWILLVGHMIVVGPPIALLLRAETR